MQHYIGRRSFITIALILLLSGGGIYAALQIARSRLPFTPLASFSQSGVQVDVGLVAQKDGDFVLLARYTPLQANFHVYSKDLPANGLDGMGRPTRLEPISGLQITGNLNADATVIDQHISGLTEVFPVYPDGPVTLSLPVKFNAPSAVVKVSYMACSSDFGCLPPTENTVILRAP